ncbi:MAG TPA: hypothetical protein VFA37_08520 [Gaiellaceae bacterium]|nr:hypothetical protein [Gaiellaceae bacterium]
MRRAGIAALVAAAAFTPGAAAATGLSVSPLRLTLAGRTTARVTVGNSSARPLIVDVSLAGFALTMHGRPRLRAADDAAGWLRIRPRRLRIAPHASATVRVTAVPPPRAAAGDHPALVLLETRQPGGQRLRVLLRVGVVVLLRVPGPIVRRLEPRALTVRRRGETHVLELRLANRGNVTETLGRGGLRLELLRRGEAAVTLHARRRLELLPHSAGIAEFVYRGRLRGIVRAAIMGRSFRLRL